MNSSMNRIEDLEPVAGIRTTSNGNCVPNSRRTGRNDRKRCLSYCHLVIPIKAEEQLLK